jgi:hypothetical protein
MRQLKWPISVRIVAIGLASLAHRNLCGKNTEIQQKFGYIGRSSK